jgi:hypothetical protein
LKHLQPSSSVPEKDSFSSGRLLRRHAQRPYAAAPWPTIPAPRTLADGAHKFTALEKDLAGNFGSAALSFTLDTLGVTGVA